MGESPNIQHPDYEVLDWTKITFLQNFVVPEKFDFADLIADKATSFGLKDLKYRCERFGDIGPGAERSVIIRWLEQEFISPSNFLERISYIGCPADEQLAGVFPKERE